MAEQQQQQQQQQQQRAPQEQPAAKRRKRDFEHLLTDDFKQHVARYQSLQSQIEDLDRQKKALLPEFKSVSGTMCSFMRQHDIPRFGIHGGSKSVGATVTTQYSPVTTAMIHQAVLDVVPGATAELSESVAQRAMGMRKSKRVEGIRCIRHDEDQE